MTHCTRYSDSERKVLGHGRLFLEESSSYRGDLERVMEMLQNLGVAKGSERLSIVNRLHRWKDIEMDADFVLSFLKDKGIPSSSSRDELFENLLYCIWDEDEESLRELLSAENR